MITIRPAVRQEDPTSNAVPPEIGSAPEKGKPAMPMVWIPATLCLGLLIAAVYLGGRIVTAHPHASAPVKTAEVQQVQKPRELAKPAVPVTPPVAEAKVAQAKPESRPDPKPEPKREVAPPVKAPTARLVSEEEVPMIEPKPGEHYIQVGALDLEATRRYLGHLRQANLEPHVAPGPKPELLRVLIGPFSDRDSLTTAKQGLESAGIENFVRKY
jgi:cell division septation protein DedD